MAEDVITRDEVIEIFGALADIKSAVLGIVGSWKAARMKRKKRIFQTAEERKAWFEAAWERQRSLEARLAKMRAEQAAKQKPA